MKRCTHLARPLRCVVCAAAAALALIHPLIHGTPLDGGVLDGLLAQLNMLAMSWSVE